MIGGDVHGFGANVRLGGETIGQNVRPCALQRETRNQLIVSIQDGGAAEAGLR